MTKSEFPGFDASKSWVGECQCCARMQVVKKGCLVLHGYERPGYGWIDGRCPGENYAPFELSCTVAKSYRTTLIERSIPVQSEWIAALEADAVEELTIQVPNGYDYSCSRGVYGRPRKKYEARKIRRGYVHVSNSDLGDYDGGKTFDQYRREQLASAQKHLKELHSEVVRLESKIASWKYAPESLELHSTVKQRERDRVEEGKLWRLFVRRWVGAWSYVGRAVADHKSDWECLVKLKGDVDLLRNWMRDTDGEKRLNERIAADEKRLAAVGAFVRVPAKRAK